MLLPHCPQPTTANISPLPKQPPLLLHNPTTTLLPCPQWHYSIARHVHTMARQSIRPKERIWYVRDTINIQQSKWSVYDISLGLGTGCVWDEGFGDCAGWRFGSVGLIAIDCHHLKKKATSMLKWLADILMICVLLYLQRCLWNESSRVSGVYEKNNCMKWLVGGGIHFRGTLVLVKQLGSWSSWVLSGLYTLVSAALSQKRMQQRWWCQ